MPPPPSSRWNTYVPASACSRRLRRSSITALTSGMAEYAGGCGGLASPGGGRERSEGLLPPPLLRPLLPPRRLVDRRELSRRHPSQRILRAVLDREHPERERLRLAPPPLVHQHRHQEPPEPRRILRRHRVRVGHRQRPPDVPLRLGALSGVELVPPQPPRREHDVRMLRPVGPPHPHQRLLVVRLGRAVR